MKTCPVCQKFVTDQAKFCYYCGASLLNVAPDVPAPEIEPQPVEETVEPAVEAVEEPVAETVEEAVETVEEPAVEAVEEPTETMEEPVFEATEEAAEAAEETVETVEEPVPVTEPAPVEEPVVKAVEDPAPAAEPAPAPVVTPVAASVQPVVNATDSRSLMTTAGYIFTTILFHIPIIGLIFMIVWGCGKPKNISRKRFSLAMLIMRLLGVIVFLLIAVFLLVCFSDRIPGLFRNVPMM